MHQLRKVLGSRSFMGGFGLIALVQLLVLGFTTPLYDIDTNSFIRGGLSWDVYHNPFENIFIAVAGLVWKSAWFFAALQAVFYAFAAAVFIHVVLPQSPWKAIGMVFAAIEPVTLFYNLSILPESFFTSFTLLYCSAFILWLRKPEDKYALLSGFFLGLTFLCKLSAMVQLALLGLMLLHKNLSPGKRIRHAGLALIPFAAFYLFVMLGQRWINGGELYTVAGRVRWDFSSSQYVPHEIEGDEFKRLVDPFIFKDGKRVEHRELRRELSYLGYKDCVAEYELRTGNESRAITFCDSLFGSVGSQIIKKHLLAAEWQFVKDNLWCIHHLNYLDYRFTPGMYYYHPETEYAYLDSLMEQHFGVNLAKNKDRIPGIWQNLPFANTWVPLLWWIIVFSIFLTAIRWKKAGPGRRVTAAAILIPLVFHLVYISWRTRFFAPYFVAGFTLALATCSEILEGIKSARGRS